MRPNQLVGIRFNRLTVVADGGRDAKKNVLWLCVCDCGGKALAPAYDLKAGKVKSCGCLSKEGNHRTHGHARKGKKRNPTYSLWATMIQRCTNPNDRSWAAYGGRGIEVCKSWLTFEGFYADMGDKPKGLTLERINVDKGYNRKNCVWATQHAQARNKRSNVWVTIDGESKILSDWVEYIGVTKPAIYYRKHKKQESYEQIVRYFLNQRRA